MRDNPIFSTVDFTQDGIQHGHLRLPHSSNESAWGAIQIPISVIRNGSGPCALLTGGNHGDEYEGPIALAALAHELSAVQVSGTILILPYMNYPAVRAGTRVSPIDGVNMNRAFPGLPDGTASQKIADYFERILLPMADLVLDFHSGGKTLDFLPFAAHHVLDDKAQEARCRAARDAFNAPFSVEMREIDALGMYDHAAEAQGKTFVTTELGGGGTARPATIEIARRGLRNVLIHAGILAGEPELRPSVQMTQPDDACFHFAMEHGMIAFNVELGESVARGQELAQVWDISRNGAAPKMILARRDGILIARHHPGLVQLGDCAAVLGVAL